MKNNHLIFKYIVLFLFVCFFSCETGKNMTVDELKEKYSLEELEELYQIKQDTSTFSITKYNKQLYEENNFIKSDTIKEALKVIYGPDDRLDFYQEQNAERVKNAMGVVALVWKWDLVQDDSGMYKLNTKNFGTSQNLCSTEKFSSQPVGAFCSGFAVNQNTIVTAGHCFKIDSELEDIRFIFGYKLNTINNVNITFSPEAIFSAKRLISKKLDNGRGKDYAIIETNEQIPPSHILLLTSNTKIADNEEVYVIGHPVGLPLKIAGGANVRDNSNVDYFIANLDTYGGNSGSPIFNSQTNKVEGILVRGEVDFKSQGECNVSNPCPNTGCRGEDVTRVSQFKEFLISEAIQ
ncbi:MAG: trypsin-like peptidase domain-containing protein [Algibacter sp.]